MLNILVDMAVHDPCFRRLSAMPGVEVRLCDGDHEERRKQPASLIRDMEIILCTELPTNYNLMNQLRYIQISSSGFSQLSGLNLDNKEIRVCNARGVQDIPIAEWAIAMMINLTRDLPAMFRHQQNAIWDRHPRFQREIHGKTLGIWGYGGIGRQTSRIAKALGLQVHVMTRQPIRSVNHVYCVPGQGDVPGTLPDRAFLPAELKEFCSELDFLLLAMPLNHQNSGIVNSHVFDLLPESAFLLNPARGPLIVEQDLLEALHNRRIAGIALDTHYHYPMPPDHPLWNCPGVVMTPHISGSASSPRFAERVWDIFIQNIERYRSGGPLINELTIEQLTS